MAQKPQQFINWCSDGAASKITQPPPSQQLAGWAVGQPPPAQWFNWLFYTLDQWIQWFSQTTDSLAADSNTSLQNCRLLGGGPWSWAASAGTLTWGSSFSLAIPSEPDSNNTIAAGSVTLAPGQVAYVAANLAFSATATSTNNSATLTAVSAVAGIAAGMQAVGTNIPAGTTVVSTTSTTVTLSASCTASGTAPVSFYATAMPTVQVATSATFAPPYNAVIIARATGTVCYLGVGSGQMILHDLEAKNLLENGYTGIAALTAGQALSAGTLVYISPGASDGSRTQGALYPCDASQTYGAVRSAFIGVLMTSVAQGATGYVVTDGVFQAYGLTPGAIYYADPANPGGITVVKPTTVGQYVAPMGTALNATWLDLNPSQGASVSQVVASFNDNSYAVRTENDFNNAITACTAAGGGEIFIVDPVTITTNKVIPAATTVTGRSGAAPITTTAGAAVQLSDNCMVGRLWLTTAQTGAVSLLTVAGNYAVVRDSHFAVPQSGSGTCVTVTGSGNRLKDNVFTGVAAGSSGTGINYQGGGNNFDYDSIFLA